MPAVMCMAETRIKPSLICDLASAFSTSSVMLMNSRCFFVLNHRYSVCDFIACPLCCVGCCRKGGAEPVPTCREPRRNRGCRPLFVPRTETPENSRVWASASRRRTSRLQGVCDIDVIIRALAFSVAHILVYMIH